MATYLTKNFTLEELLRSGDADRRGIVNNPTQSARENLAVLAYNLQSIRDYLGKGIKVTSGYRCPVLNKAVGGAPTSQHTTGYAADIKPMDGNMTELKRIVLVWSKSHPFDQIILEQCNEMGIPSWIHFGACHNVHGFRRQILTAKKVNGKWIYKNYQE